MTRTRLYLYDDATGRSWEPFALTRPVGELLLGAHTFRERAERILGLACAGHITSLHLAGFEEPGAPPVVAPERIPDDAARLFLNSRFVPTGDAAFAPPGGPAVLTADSGVAGWYAPPGAPGPDAEWFEAPEARQAAPYHLPGRMVAQIWDLVAQNPSQIEADFAAAETRSAGSVDPGGYAAVGGRLGRLRVGRGVTIEPNVVLDFTDGPIWLDDAVTVRAFTRLAGPAFIGQGTTLLGGPYAGSSIGPVCKVHGELEESVILGYSNKAHDGFIGHAYLGRWVNLGAMTTNSDLKNNYGEIRMWTPDGDTGTGLTKLGCLLGDHVKTGIGALLNTGTVIGAGSNVYGTDMPPTFVPPFSWGTGSELVAYDLSKFLQVAATAMARRDVVLTEGMRGMLAEAWRRGRPPA
jgi:UDP-N-acetylglucosamine diphosphorylase / glucose-1-phosphate thymidylyltransferase / UDP-N-acetylgalactosamine diphosphorylase / glucosamine-1-phosphate N-acetyltransferase / galactosamine-1-phosphate N-acetyltransferase